MHIKNIILLATVFSSFNFVIAARLEIVSPPRANHTSDPVMVQVILDPENDVISGISGDLSYPSRLFEIHSISTDGTLVSPWIFYPKIKEGEYLDGRTHITFEGIFAGGFGGVKSAYGGRDRKGIIFTAILLPKEKGNGIISLDNIIVNAFDEKATPLLVNPSYASIFVPDLISNAILPRRVVKEVSPNSLFVYVEKSELLHMGAWYLTVYDNEPKSAIEAVYVIESDSPGVILREDTRWKKVTTPHILFHQDRSKFVHVRVDYSNGAYAFKMIAPVENLQLSNTISRILSSVVTFVLLYVLYAYLTNHVRFFSKKDHTKSS